MDAQCRGTMTPPRADYWNKHCCQCSFSARAPLIAPVFVFQGQILANMKAMDSDWFAQNYMGRKTKVGGWGR